MSKQNYFDLLKAASHGNKDIILYVMNNVDTNIASFRSYIDILELAISQKAVTSVSTWKRVAKQALDNNDELLLRFVTVNSPYE